MKLNIDLPYKLRRLDRNQFETNSDITETLFVAAAQAVYPRMGRTDSMVFGAIQDKCYEAKNGYIELSQTEFDWLSSLIDKAEIDARLSSWRCTLMRYFDDCRRRSEIKEVPKEVKKEVVGE